MAVYARGRIELVFQEWDWGLLNLSGPVLIHSFPISPCASPIHHNHADDDGANSLFLCCGQEDAKGNSLGAHYVVTFCPR